MIPETIPQEIINTLSAKLSRVRPVYKDGNSRVHASYEDAHWLIEVSLDYDVWWRHDTDGAGQDVHIPYTTPTEFEVERCDYYARPDDDDPVADLAEQLITQLNKTL